MHKMFSLEEANHEISRINEEITIIKTFQQHFFELHHQLKWIRAFYDKQQDSSINENIFILECKLEFMNIMAKMHIKNIQNKGALLKDINLGIIDFPALYNDQFIYYSWKLGEDEILYYHKVTEGYHKRKLIH